MCERTDNQNETNRGLDWKHQSHKNKNKNGNENNNDSHQLTLIQSDYYVFLFGKIRCYVFRMKIVLRKLQKMRTKFIAGDLNARQ